MTRGSHDTLNSPVLKPNPEAIAASHLVVAVWARMRDELQVRVRVEGRAIPPVGSDMSFEGIAEQAYSLAGLLFTQITGRRARDLLTPVGALATLAGAARMLSAGQAVEASQLAALARDLFNAWANGLVTSSSEACDTAEETRPGGA